MGLILGRYSCVIENNWVQISFSQFFLVYLPWTVYALVNMGIYPQLFYIFYSLT